MGWKVWIRIGFLIGFRMLLSNRLSIELASSQTTLEFCAHLLDKQMLMYGQKSHGLSLTHSRDFKCYNFGLRLSLKVRVACLPNPHHHYTNIQSILSEEVNKCSVSSIDSTNAKRIRDVFQKRF